MKIIEQSRPARFDKAVMFCCDANYLPFALFAARQIALLPGERDYDICIVTCDEVEFPAPLLGLEIRLCRVNVGDMFAGQKSEGRLSGAAFMRLALPDAFGASYQRILYLDSDVYVEGGDFSALFEIDLGKNCLAALRDNKQWANPARQLGEFAALGMQPAKYLNSGVMLISCSAFERARIRERCLSIGREHHHRFSHFDQALLNCALHGEWAELSPVWNWQWPLKRQLFEQIEGPNIVHFITGMKPWKGDWKGDLPPRYRKAYDRFLKAYFPDVQVEFPARNRLRDPFWLLIILLRRAATRSKLLRYLARFSHDLDVKT